MSYLRVIPRDLFNEANLLKCFGQLYLEVDKLNDPGVVIEHHSEHDKFDVYQNPDDGSLALGNVVLLVKGLSATLYRPLNSREPWPLYCVPEDDDKDEIAVFNDDGTLTAEMLNFLRGGS